MYHRRVFAINAIHTLAFAGVVLFAGYAIRQRLGWLARLNIPAPVIGGLIVSLVMTIGHVRGRVPFAFDTTWRDPLMIAFFTSVGFGASLGLLRRGGPLVVLFLAASSVFTVLQNVLGVIVARLLGQPPLFGVLAGSVTLAGGPATGLAFAPFFEQAGVTGAETIAVAAAMAGIVSGGLIGGPVGTWLIERRVHRGTAATTTHASATVAQHVVESELPGTATPPRGEDREAYALMKATALLLLAMWVGAGISDWLTAQGVVLPRYIGAMLAAIVLRNIDELTGWLGISQAVIDDLGTVALAFFIVIALMTLKLWQLAGLALPLAALLVVQIVFVAVIAPPVIFRLMGRDYDAAVMASGFIGFMLGTTANAMANMEALTERYGVAPRAFLVVPMVGAFFIDVVNNVVITAFLNVYR
ncbi:Glutamate permease [Luteitalea pratensis]|uniref:Sodium/glutamate symporter n=1 Tax=Luteitalea pratensis TaxID=1855912 RepID=A0A143PNV6_LUTPR|nr:Glutamate permease [Luteitalea pratensis]